MSTYPGGKLKSQITAAARAAWQRQRPHKSCWRLAKLLLFSAIVAGSLPATTIQFEATTNGSTGEYQYLVSGFVANQACPDNPSIECTNEIDIMFDPNMFVQLSNGVAPADFDLLLFQPNNPPGADGDYSAYALDSNPSLAGPFSVDFTYNPLVSSSVSPCSTTPDFCQNFAIESYDSNGFFEGYAETGVTTPFTNATPEPVSFVLSGIALLIGGFVRARRLSS